MKHVIQVAIPVLKGRTTVVVDKGRPWSVIEHLLLEALSRKEWTAAELSRAAKLPRRVVVEALIRLMRAGWVDLSESKSVVSFLANPFGGVAAGRSELPQTFERARRQVNFSVDLVDGGVFRNREWYVYDEYSVRERGRKELLVWIEPKSIVEVWDSDEFYEILLDYDETLVSAEPSGYSRKYVLVSVHNGVIHGLPDRELTNLRAAILQAAASIDPKEVEKTHVFSTPGVSFATHFVASPERSIHFETTDLVLDGEAHKKVLKHTFENADRNIYIHSTFISEEKVLAWLPEITAAVKRGVKIQILWGQNEDAAYVVSSRTSISNLAKNKDLLNLGDSFLIHPFSTGSHAKLIVADSGRGGAFVAVVGSCNWLSSGFESYEVSVVLRDAQIVRDVVRYFSDLSVRYNGVWSDLATELTKISKNLKTTPGAPKPNARASVVIGGAQHESYVLRARDEAQERVFAASHRLGPVSVASVLTPLMQSAKTNKVQANVYYGRTTGAVWGSRQDVIVDEAATAGVSVELIKSPRLHAKVLAWDEDSVLITSLNWLSAASGDTSLKEIGIYIEAKRAAQVVTSNFQGARCETSTIDQPSAELELAGKGQR
ncbi:MAG: phospholipase D-like domain-containing protein [Pseudomonadota bacterium]